MEASQKNFPSVFSRDLFTMTNDRSRNREKILTNTFTKQKTTE